jgi:hypothetical protein
MTTAGPGGEVSVRRAVAVLVLGVAIAAGAAGVTMLLLILRSVTAEGGSCADGGPSDLAQPCPSGTGTALLLAWPALFLTQGWSLLADGCHPPMGEEIAGGYPVCGAVFALMGAGPPLWRLTSSRCVR